ncbi:MAG: hypothetical protein H6Q64_692 [Firmicutes bacterium]|nr:hypothetical protein [Bacillota bacterium]MBP2641337.1 hypothetical protein [Bacillota bacterium]
MQKLPVKFRVFQIISQYEDIANEELYKILKQEYPLDRHVTLHGIDNYLMSLKAVGLIRNSLTLLSDTGTMIQKYQLTENGVNKLKYI